LGLVDRAAHGTPLDAAGAGITSRLDTLAARALRPRARDGRAPNQPRSGSHGRYRRLARPGGPKPPPQPRHEQQAAELPWGAGREGACRRARRGGCERREEPAAEHRQSDRRAHLGAEQRSDDPDTDPLAVRGHQRKVRWRPLAPSARHSSTLWPGWAPGLSVLRLSTTVRGRSPSSATFCHTGWLGPLAGADSYSAAALSVPPVKLAAMYRPLTGAERPRVHREPKGQSGLLVLQSRARAVGLGDRARKLLAATQKTATCGSSPPDETGGPGLKPWASRPEKRGRHCDRVSRQRTSRAPRVLSTALDGLYSRCSCAIWSPQRRGVTGAGEGSLRLWHARLADCELPIARRRSSNARPHYFVRRNRLEAVEAAVKPRVAGPVSAATGDERGRCIK
jgi:hypothetical protein